MILIFNFPLEWGVIRMDWKAMALEKLRGYAAMRASLGNLEDELALLELGGGDPKAQRALERAARQAQCWTRQVEAAMSVLTPEERRILDKCYVNRKRGAVDDLCGELGVEYSTVYRWRDRALRRFAKAMFGNLAIDN